MGLWLNFPDYLPLRSVEVGAGPRSDGFPVAWCVRHCQDRLGLGLSAKNESSSPSLRQESGIILKNGPERVAPPWETFTASAHFQVEGSACSSRL